MNIQQTQPEHPQTAPRIPPDPSLSRPAFGPPPPPDPLDALIDRVAKTVVNELEQPERVRAIATEVIRQMDERAGQQETPEADAEPSPATDTAEKPEQEESNV